MQNKAILRAAIFAAALVSLGFLAHTASVALAPPAGPASSKPVWGEQKEGYAVSLVLDKSIYALDEKIPLHIACTRFGDDWRMEGMASELKLCQPEIEVTHADGNALQDADVNPCFKAHIGGLDSYVIKHVEKETVIPYEPAINDPRGCMLNGGIFIVAPGAYRVRAVWQPATDVSVYSTSSDFRITGR